MRIALIVGFAFVLAAAAQASGHARQAAVFNLYEVRLDGTGRRALLQNPAIRNVADVSPDGKQMLFVEGNQRLYAAGIDGSAVRLLAASDNVDDAVWSPNGRRIAFEGADDSGCVPVATGCGIWQVWLVNPDSSGLRLLADRALAPSWAPGSRRVAFFGRYDTYAQRGALTVATVGDSASRQLGPVEPQDSVASRKPEWSPRGDRLAYTAPGRGHSVIRVALANGSGRRTVHTLVGGADPSWSADGEQLAFWSVGSKSLYVVDADGRHRRRLTSGVAPIWSPNGRWIAFFDRAAACYQIFLIKPSGRGRHPVTNEPCPTSFDIFWVRNGSRLIYGATAYSG